MLCAAGAQAKLEKDLGPFDAPAVLAVNVEKKKFVLHHGSMSEQSVNAFCEGIMIGKGSSFELKATPTVRNPPLQCLPSRVVSCRDPLTVSCLRPADCHDGAVGRQGREAGGRGGVLPG